MESKTGWEVIDGLITQAKNGWIDNGVEGVSNGFGEG